ncbi:MAG: hypothetical protein A4E35_01097 [Methanoregula sp. PtaU1.Bin051]|nr:MAG: hypothetical protein A4E35_01097 [Methanoregula sp. PtaU1.Bin051]
MLALVTTWAIEIPVLVALFRFLFREKSRSFCRIIFTGLLCTALTLPYLWFVLPPFVDAAYYPLIGEALVVVVEAVLINCILGFDVKRSAACSLIMNAASFGLGLVLL